MCFELALFHLLLFCCVCFVCANKKVLLYVVSFFFFFSFFVARLPGSAFGSARLGCHSSFSSCTYVDLLHTGLTHALCFYAAL